VKSIEEVRNDGMTQWTQKELAHYVKKVRELKNDGKAPVPVMETRNFVGEFVSELNLRAFPFDQQDLRITVMSNMTSDVTFTHKVPRDGQTKVAKPGRTKDGAVICTIKCNLEADTLSEWDVLLQEGKTLAEDTLAGTPALAVVKYDFKEHDKAFSAEGAIYQRLDFYVYVERELKNMMFSIIIPSTMLSASSLSIFSLTPDEQRGDRLSILFTIILTIVANQFVTQGRLPYLAYFTWLDAVMLGLQLFVYAIVIETATIESFAMMMDMTTHEADMIALYVMLAMFGVMLVLGIGSGLRLYCQRRRGIRAAEIEGAGSFDREEIRLERIWFPERFPSENVDANDSHVVNVKVN